MTGIPHAFVVDRNNKIVFSGHPMDGGFESSIRKAVAAAGPPPAPVAQSTEIPPPIKATREELMAMSVGDLKSTSAPRPHPPPAPQTPLRAYPPNPTLTLRPTLRRSHAPLTEILTDRQKPILGLIEKSDLVDTILRKCT